MDPFRYLTRLSCHPNLRHNYHYIRVLWDNNLLPALFTVASLGFVKRTKDQRRKDMSSPPLLIYIPPKHNFPKKLYHAQNPFSLHHTWLCQILNVHWSIGRCQFIRIKIQNSNQNNLRRMFCRPHIISWYLRILKKPIIIEIVSFVVHVVLYVGHQPFWTKKFWPGWQGGSGKVKIGQNIAQNRPRFWLWSPLEAPKWVKDPWNGP